MLGWLFPDRRAVRLGTEVAAGSLPAGQSVTLTTSVTATRAGIAFVAAAAGSGNLDPNPPNNRAAVTVRVTGR
jgi:hypothetical protein